MSLESLLESQDLTEALELTEESMLEEHAMLEEALDDTFEQPSESEEMNDLQFFNQDHASGITDDDFNNSFHPDDVSALNDAGKGAGVEGSDDRSTSIFTQLMAESTDTASSTEEETNTELTEEVTTLSDSDYGDDNPLTLEDLDDLPDDDDALDGFGPDEEEA